MTPEVSIIMPAYNAERYIADALASLRGQDCTRLEAIVVDDGSTDATAAIVAAIAAADPRVRLIGGHHCGVSQARNAGIANAHGAYISFLDADDLLPPGKVARQAARLHDDPEAGAITGEMLLFQEVDANLVPLPGTRSDRILGIQLGAATFRRSVFERCGALDPAMGHAEDVDFYLRLFEADIKIIVETEIAVLYRRHQANCTNDRAASRRGFLEALHKSLVRRRAAGVVRPLPGFFHGRHLSEREFDGGR